jgi:hypothetical protein
MIDDTSRIPDPREHVQHSDRHSASAISDGQGVVHSIQLGYHVHALEWQTKDSPCRVVHALAQGADCRGVGEHFCHKLEA